MTAPMNASDDWLLTILNGLVAPFGIADSSRVGEAHTTIQEHIQQEVRKARIATAEEPREAFSFDNVSPQVLIDNYIQRLKSVGDKDD